MIQNNRIKGENIMKKYFSFILVVLLIVISVGCKKEDSTTTNQEAVGENAQAEVVEQPETDGLIIGFSNSFNGNTYRQTMESEFKKLAQEMIMSGVIEDYKILESNNNIATQVTQIESLILDGVDAIILDPGSASGLNGAIERAWDAGIPVIIINDGPVTTDKCYEINFDTALLAKTAIQYLVDRLDGKGNIINIRGMAGVPFDEDFNNALQEVLAENPEMKIVGEVYGEWTSSVAQQQIASILPSIDHVDGVIGQGGDGYGAVQAFESSDKELPIIIGGNRGNFLSWWAEKKLESGYETFSWASNPWNGAAALYVAVDILNGEDVPRVMVMSGLNITQDMIEDYDNLPADYVAVGAYDHQWIIDNLYK